MRARSSSGLSGLPGAGRVRSASSTCAVHQPILPAAPYRRDPQAISRALPDFADVKGQAEAKRALEIAASGGHNVLLIGAPGSGKSMLAKRLPSILPRHALCGDAWRRPRFYSVAGPAAGAARRSSRRARSAPPHHTDLSARGFRAAGTIPRPGEISLLAHNGVLFLDELPEFSRSAMEALRTAA